MKLFLQLLSVVLLPAFLSFFLWSCKKGKGVEWREKNICQVCRHQHNLKSSLEVICLSGGELKFKNELTIAAAFNVKSFWQNFHKFKILKLFSYVNQQKFTLILFRKKSNLIPAVKWILLYNNDMWAQVLHSNSKSILIKLLSRDKITENFSALFYSLQKVIQTKIDASLHTWMRNDDDNFIKIFTIFWIDIPFQFI